MKTTIKTAKSTTATPTLQELRDRLAILTTATAIAPHLLSAAGLAMLDAHNALALEYGVDSEEICAESAIALLMRERLAATAPEWFMADTAAPTPAPKFKRTVSDIRSLARG